ncbi:pyrroline-5-carboxylate reductase [Abditibacteriota bacterium]|nr:pyrroline-5-carboxylate reductase [Abditibacteriota bacterium]
MPTLSFIGAGAMGEALSRGLIAAGTYAPSDLVLFDVDTARVQTLAQSLGARAASSVEDAVQGADVVLLAVKPQMVETALAPVREALTPQQTLVSIAAGVSTKRLEACFVAPIPVVRVMPNTPALVGAAATAVCAGAHATTENLDKARAIFAAVGLCVQADEKLLDAVTGLSGSGPAYVFLFIEALADGGVRAGLARDVALQLAAQTVLGSAQMVLETGKHPGVLKDQVASPGGTTIAGLHALENGAFRGTVMDAVLAATNRSRELG